MLLAASCDLGLLSLVPAHETTSHLTNTLAHICRAAALDVDPSGGHRSEAAVASAREQFGANALPPKRARSFYEFVLDALEDPIMALLVVAAVISIALALAFGEDPEVEWLEGLAILVAVLIVVLVTAVNDYLKEQKFVELEKVKDTRLVRVQRAGRSVTVPLPEIVVGDVLVRLFLFLFFFFFSSLLFLIYSIFFFVLYSLLSSLFFFSLSSILFSVSLLRIVDFNCLFVVFIFVGFVTFF